MKAAKSILPLEMAVSRSGDLRVATCPSQISLLQDFTVFLRQPMTGFLGGSCATNPTLISQEPVVGRKEITDRADVNVGRADVVIVKPASNSDGIKGVEKWLGKMTGG